MMDKKFVPGVLWFLITLNLTHEAFAVGDGPYYKPLPYQEICRDDLQAIADNRYTDQIDALLKPLKELHGHADHTARWDWGSPQPRQRLKEKSKALAIDLQIEILALERLREWSLGLPKAPPFHSNRYVFHLPFQLDSLPNPYSRDDENTTQRMDLALFRYASLERRYPIHMSDYLYLALVIPNRALVRYLVYQKAQDATEEEFFLNLAAVGIMQAMNRANGGYRRTIPPQQWTERATKSAQIYLALALTKFNMAREEFLRKIENIGILREACRKEPGLGLDTELPGSKTRFRLASVDHFLSHLREVPEAAVDPKFLEDDIKGLEDDPYGLND